MSFILGAAVLFFLFVGVVALLFAIVKPNLRLPAGLLALMSLGFAGTLVAVFLWTVARMG